MSKDYWNVYRGVKATYPNETATRIRKFTSLELARKNCKRLIDDERIDSGKLPRYTDKEKRISGKTRIVSRAAMERIHAVRAAKQGKKTPKKKRAKAKKPRAKPKPKPRGAKGVERVIKQRKKKASPIKKSKLKEMIPADAKKVAFNAQMRADTSRAMRSQGFSRSAAENVAIRLENARRRQAKAKAKARATRWLDDEEGDVIRPLVRAKKGRRLKVRKVGTKLQKLQEIEEDAVIREMEDEGIITKKGKMKKKKKKRKSKRGGSLAFGGRAPGMPKMRTIQPIRKKKRGGSLAFGGRWAAHPPVKVNKIRKSGGSLAFGGRGLDFDASHIFRGRKRKKKRGGTLAFGGKYGGRGVDLPKSKRWF